MHDIDKRQQLAVWTIVTMRWPTLADYLIESIGGRARGPSDDVRPLFEREDVRNVLDGNGIGVALVAEAIGLFAGLRTPHAIAGAAA